MAEQTATLLGSTSSNQRSASVQGGQGPRDEVCGPATFRAQGLRLFSTGGKPSLSLFSI
jgi:hypothetical protein